MFRKIRDEVAGKATEVADKISAEVGKAGQFVIAAICLSAVALVVAVVALVMGVRPRHAG